MGPLYWQIRWTGVKLEQRIKDFTTPKVSKAPFLIQFMETILTTMGPQVVGPLTKVLHRTSLPTELRQGAARILRHFSDEEAVRAIIQVADNVRETSELRVFAVHILSRQGHPRVVEHALSILREGLVSEDETVRNHAGSDLWLLEWFPSTVIRKQELEEVLLPYLHIANPRARTAATVSRKVGSRKSVEPLKKLVLEAMEAKATSGPLQSIPHIATTSIGYVGQQASDEAVPFLLERLFDEREALVRGAAAGALARIGPPEAIAALGQQIQREGDGHALWFEVSSLYCLGGQEAIRELRRLKQSIQEGKGNPWAMEYIEEAIIRLEQEPIPTR